MTDGMDLDDVARRLGRIAAEAGALLAALSDRSAGHRVKEDGSPSTDADTASEELILRRLAEEWPDIPVVAEESAGREVASGLFFLVDPLDGTRDYLTGAGEYSVNIALVRGDRPVAAAVAAPSLGRVWAAGAGTISCATDGEGAWAWRPASVRRGGRDGLVALVSRRHGDEVTETCLAELRVAARRTASSAVKFCLIASGEADIYVRCGPTMEWDTAAGDLIVERAGGAVVGPDRRPLTYGHAARGYLNGPFAAFGDPELARTVNLPGSCP